MDVTAALVAGENRVTAEVSNEGSASGFVLQLVVEQGDSRSYIVTSDAWKAAEVGNREEKPAKIVATYGDGPWGSVFDNPDYGNSSAGALMHCLDLPSKSYSRIRRLSLVLGFA